MDKKIKIFITTLIFQHLPMETKINKNQLSLLQLFFLRMFTCLFNKELSP